MSPSRTSTRWCPTPEQVMILEELYRRGLKTPKAAQIQRITAHLSFFGKIQGKNVFYWFQNHKARDRQKLRKRIAKQQQQLHQLHQLQPHQLLDDPQTRFLPPPFHPHHHHLSHIHYSAQYLLPQGAAVSEDNSIATTADHFLMMRRINGHDSATIMGVGPTYPPCFREEDKQPLQTLELFPLRSSSTS